jgi:hypothetical protein
LLSGQLNVEGQGLSTSSFTNPTALNAMWDPPNNVLQMTISLPSATANAQTVLVNGVVTGQFRNRS